MAWPPHCERWAHTVSTCVSSRFWDLRHAAQVHVDGGDHCRSDHVCGHTSTGVTSVTSQALSVIAATLVLVLAIPKPTHTMLSSICIETERPMCHSVVTGLTGTHNSITKVTLSFHVCTPLKGLEMCINLNCRHFMPCNNRDFLLWLVLYGTFYLCRDYTICQLFEAHKVQVC